MKTGIELIAEERNRQITDEGWNTKHDDNHDAGELAGAGAAYALHASCELHPIGDGFDPGDIPPGWCWDKKWWKPKNPIADLKRAGALIAAEIDRLQRIRFKELAQAELEAYCPHGFLVGCPICMSEQPLSDD